MGLRGAELKSVIMAGLSRDDVQAQNASPEADGSMSRRFDLDVVNPTGSAEIGAKRGYDPTAPGLG